MAEAAIPVAEAAEGVAMSVEAGAVEAEVSMEVAVVAPTEAGASQHRM